jgi:hypothetical protein
MVPGGATRDVGGSARQTHRVQALQDRRQRMRLVVDARHHTLGIDRIVDLVERRSPKRSYRSSLRQGTRKSTWLSLIFPAWYLGKHP